MIGKPPIIFMDEPSTGMDPVNKRFMWEVIARVCTSQKECSIILVRFDSSFPLTFADACD